MQPTEGAGEADIHGSLSIEYFVLPCKVQRLNVPATRHVTCKNECLCGEMLMYTLIRNDKLSPSGGFSLKITISTMCIHLTSRSSSQLPSWRQCESWLWSLCDGWVLVSSPSSPESFCPLTTVGCSRD